MFGRVNQKSLPQFGWIAAAGVFDANIEASPVIRTSASLISITPAISLRTHTLASVTSTTPLTQTWEKPGIDEKKPREAHPFPFFTNKDMKRKSDGVIGELIFRTNDGKRAVVRVYRGNDTFTLRRVMWDGTLDERVNIDVYGGNLRGYASEAALKWSDLELDGVELRPT